MFSNSSEQEKEKLKDIINQLLAVNFMMKEVDKEKYQVARRHKEELENYFKFLGWEFVVDDRNDCLALISPRQDHRMRMTKEESIWLLILRLLYQEKRQGISLSEFPMVTLFDIKHKYQTFKFAFPNKSLLKQMVGFCKRYQLIEVKGADVTSDDCPFLLYHTFLHVVDTELLEGVAAKIQRYERGEEGTEDEVDEEITSH